MSTNCKRRVVAVAALGVMAVWAVSLLTELSESRTRTVSVGRWEEGRDDVLDALVYLHLLENRITDGNEVDRGPGLLAEAKTTYAEARSGLDNLLAQDKDAYREHGFHFPSLLAALDSEVANQISYAEAHFFPGEKDAPLAKDSAASDEPHEHSVAAPSARNNLDASFQRAINISRSAVNHARRAIAAELTLQRHIMLKLYAATFALPLMIGVALWVFLSKSNAPSPTWGRSLPIALTVGGVGLVVAFASKDPSTVAEVAAFAGIPFAITAYLAANVRARSREAQRSTFKLIDFVDYAPLGLHWLDNKGFIQWANQTEMALLGYAPEEYIGRHIGEFHASRDVVDDIFKRLAAGESLHDYEVQLVCKDGSPRTALISSNVLWEDGEFVHSRWFTRDITAHKRAEEEKAELELQLQQKQKMEAIGALAGGIAHDFNNLLTVITGNVELELEFAELGQDERRRARLKRISQAGARARELVRQILTFSRQDTANREPVALDRIVEETLEIVASTLPAMIEIRRDIEPTERLVLADPSQLHQIVLNLCTNAYQAIGDQRGTLSISVHAVTFDGVTSKVPPDLVPGSYVKLSVSDTGCGMDAQLKERIFEPFYTTKPINQGTGLGLSVVHGIVTELGGAITTESGLGRGTTFDVYLPLMSSDTAAATDVDVDHDDVGGSERILLVDDEPCLVDTTKDMLQLLGYSVTAFTNPKEALEALRTQPDAFDLVITDYAMPELSGVELAGLLRSAGCKVPIMLASGYSSSVTTLNARELGFSGYISKPFRMSEIAQAVRKTLAQEASFVAFVAPV